MSLSDNIENKICVTLQLLQDDAPKQGGDGNWQCWTHDPDGVKLELMQIGETSLQMEFIKSLNK